MKLNDQAGGPSVEDIKVDSKHKQVTFLYYDNTGTSDDVKVTRLGYCVQVHDQEF